MPSGGHPYEDLATTARTLLGRANGSWRSLAGRLELWEDEAWLDKGRARYHGSPASQVPSADEPKGLAYRFVIASEPWRVRMVLVWSRRSPHADSDPDLLVVRGATWWARTGEILVTNDGDSRSSHGLYYLDLLTQPAGLADSLAYISGAQAAEEDRPVIRVNAAPTEVTRLRAPSLVVLSANRYELDVDAGLGILRRVRCLIGDRLARQVMLRELRVNPPIDETDFAPPLASCLPPK